MTGRFAAAVLMFGFGVCTLADAWAQDVPQKLEAGKTPAQLFATDCGLCHKSPQGLAKAAPLFGLTSFLREHYTSSRETAAALSAYLQSVDQPAAAKPVQKRSAARPPADKAKPADKPADKAADKPAEAGKPAEPKPESSAASAPSPAAEKPPAEKPEASKPLPEKPPEAKPAEPAPEKAN